MRNPFRKRARDPVEAVLRDVKRQIGEMDERFRRLEESLNRLNAKFPQVTIESVHIHQPVLEKLEFRLDALDIEQLSGSLNLGNNFGTRLTSERKPESSGSGSQDQAGRPGPSAASEGLERTPSGFRVNYRR